jgi:uncharacterized membrane protein
MDTESNRKTTRLARISLVLGILSFGLFILASLSLIWVKLAHLGEYQAMLYVYSAFLVFLGSLILGLPGLVIAMLALVRIGKDGSDNQTQRTAIIGLVLGGVGPAFILFYLAFSVLFYSPAPPPVQITPSSISPLSP